MILNVVLLPFAGKWLGRKVAYWGKFGLCGLDRELMCRVAWARYIDFGWEGMFRYSNRER